MCGTCPTHSIHLCIIKVVYYKLWSFYNVTFSVNMCSKFTTWTEMYLRAIQFHFGDWCTIIVTIMRTLHPGMHIVKHQQDTFVRMTVHIYMSRRLHELWTLAVHYITLHYCWQVPRRRFSTFSWHINHFRLEDSGRCRWEKSSLVQTMAWWTKRRNIYMAAITANLSWFTLSDFHHK